MLPNWVGDVAMATPCLRALREQFPAPAELIGILRPYVVEVLGGTPWLDRMLTYDRRRWSSIWQLVGQLQQLRLDSMLLLTNSLSTATIARLGGARQRIGYARSGRRLLLTHAVPTPRVDGRRVPQSAIDQYLDLAAALGCVPRSRQMELHTTAADESAADRVWQRYRLDAAPRVVVLNNGAAYGASKTWPEEHFGVLAERLARETDAAVLLLCGPHERAAVARLVSRANHPRVCGLHDEPLGIGLSKACLRRSQLLITTDSGPRHLAAAFGVPVLTLFGPTDPRWSRHATPDSQELFLDLDCRPCARRTCPLGHHRCMRDLTPDIVVRALQPMLATSSAPPLLMQISSKNAAAEC